MIIQYIAGMGPSAEYRVNQQHSSADLGLSSEHRLGERCLSGAAAEVFFSCFFTTVLQVAWGGLCFIASNVCDQICYVPCSLLLLLIPGMTWFGPEQRVFLRVDELLKAGEVAKMR